MTGRELVPPGWPAAVLPPQAPEWERSATAWLFDLCPPDYRAHDVLRRHPVLLARFAAGHVASGVAAARDGMATARADLRGVVPPEAVEAAIAAYEREGPGWPPRVAPWRSSRPPCVAIVTYPGSDRPRMPGRSAERPART